MGRKNKRRKSSYSRKMKTNPKKLIMRQQNTYDVTHSRSETEHLDRVPQRGDIWFVELGCHPGTSVQDGCRPAFIISNDTANLHSGIVTVAQRMARSRSGIFICWMWTTMRSAPMVISAKGSCRGRNELFVNYLSPRLIFLLN